MPMEELNNSIKAKIWEIRYSPFFISLIFSIIIFNYRFFMILFANIDIDLKFEKLDKYAIGINDIVIPIGIALFYTGVYPIFGNWLYKVTLKYRKDAKDIRVKAESLTVKTTEEYQLLEKQKTKIEWEYEKKEKEIGDIQNEYKRKENDFISKENDLISKEKKIYPT